MATSESSSTRRRPAPRSQPEQQVYLTHCLLVDSVLHVAEYTVRAASTSDEELLRLVDRYPTYELPVVLWSKDPQPDQAPRRLALIKLSNGQRALIHSAYLPRDTVGRVGNHFTHVLIGPSFDPLDAVRSWASPGWRVEYASGETKMLPAPKGVPVGELINDEALARFLSDERLPASDASLATLTLPERLGADARRRRDLLARFLQAVILIAGDDEKPRGPLYIHAEPGFLTLLLYGAFRLLPRGWTNDLTFSTYENPDTTMRSYDRAQIVGTFLDNPRERLEEEYLDRYGYGIDTFHPSCISRDLRDPLPNANSIKTLLDLAAERDWAVLDRMHLRWGQARINLASVREDVGRTRSALRAGTGRATIEDLAMLLKDEEGRAIVDQYEGTYWPKIRDACLDDPRWIRDFRRILLKEHHLKDLRSLAAVALASEDFPRWERAWELVRSLADGNEKEQLRKLVDEAKLSDHTSLEVRALLRRAWLRSGQGEGLPWRKLIRPENEAELARMVRGEPDNPLGWKAGAICSALLMGGMTEKVRGYLESADTAMLEFVLKLGKKYLRDSVHHLVAVLANDPPAVGLLDRLLATNTEYLDAPTWVILVLKLREIQPDAWEAYWLQRERLAQFLALLEDHPDSRRLSEQYLRFIVEKVTQKEFPHDQKALKVFCLLLRGLELLTARLNGDDPVHTFAAKEITWLQRIRLTLALDFPVSTYKYTESHPLLTTILNRNALIWACKHWKEGDGSPIEPLKTVFKGKLYPGGFAYDQLMPNDPEDQKRLNIFFSQIFLRFYTLEDQEAIGTSLEAWCKIVRECSQEKQSALQNYFIRAVNVTVDQRYDLFVRCQRLLTPRVAQEIVADWENLQRQRQGEADPDEEEVDQASLEFDQSPPSTYKRRYFPKGPRGYMLLIALSLGSLGYGLWHVFQKDGLTQEIAVAVLVPEVSAYTLDPAQPPLTVNDPVKVPPLAINEETLAIAPREVAHPSPKLLSGLAILRNAIEDAVDAAEIHQRRRAAIELLSRALGNGFTDTGQFSVAFAWAIEIQRDLQLPLPRIAQTGEGFAVIAAPIELCHVICKLLEEQRMGWGAEPPSAIASRILGKCGMSTSNLKTNFNSIESKIESILYPTIAPLPKSNTIHQEAYLRARGNLFFLFHQINVFEMNSNLNKAYFKWYLKHNLGDIVSAASDPNLELKIHQVMTALGPS